MLETLTELSLLLSTLLAIFALLAFVADVLVPFAARVLRPSSNARFPRSPK